MEKLSKFKNSVLSNLGSIWGGAQPTCWTHYTEKGVTKDPCGNVDDREYMTNDGTGSSGSSAGGQ